MADVDSVNGKTGKVNLTATDVAALPLSGGTLNGPLQVTGTLSGTNITAFKNELLTAVTASSDHATLKAAIIAAIAHL